MARRKEIWQEEEKFRMNERSSSKGREVFQDRDKFVIVKKKRIACKEIEKFANKERSLAIRREVWQEV